MPSIRIELKAGLDDNSLQKIINTIMDSISEVLQLPPEDRNIRLLEYKPELFYMKPPYQVVIEISLFKGRSKETKKKLYQLIVNNLESQSLFRKEMVYIILNEVDPGNWGVRGGLPTDEIDLGFAINI
jgi:phenylpyruvate tautomerase PptA (4-oxalocrotonate tautomerase family)